MRNFFIGVLLIFFMNSCLVSKKKYDDLLAQKVAMEGDLADRSGQLDKANNDLKSLDEQLKKLKDDTANLGIDVRSTSKKLAELEKIGRAHV